MAVDAVGSTWTFAVELTRAMAAHKFVIAVMGPATASPQRTELPDNARIFERECKLEWMAGAWEDVAQAGEWLLDLEAREGPDLIHLNSYTHAALPFRAPKIVTGHSCVFSWWHAVHGEDPPEEWEIYRCAVQRGLNAAGFVVTPSQAMLNSLHEHYSFDGPERVIYHGRTGQRGAEQRQHFVFSAARFWDEAKNLQALAEAAPRINAPLKVAGDVEDRQSCLSGRDGQAGLPVLHLGRLDRVSMIRTLGEAPVYVSPSVYEPFGFSIAEAALSGCALVVGDIPSMREIWEESALYVPPRDADAIAAAVNALLADDLRRADLAERAQKRAARFNPARMAIEYDAVYHQLLARQRASSSSAFPLTAPEASA